MSLYGISLTFFLSMNDIDHSIRNTSLLGHLHEQHCRPRVLLTRLNNVRVATHESPWEHLKGRRGGGKSLSLSLSLSSIIHMCTYTCVMILYRCMQIIRVHILWPLYIHVRALNWLQLTVTWYTLLTLPKYVITVRFIVIHKSRDPLLKSHGVRASGT